MKQTVIITYDTETQELKIEAKETKSNELLNVIYAAIHEALDESTTKNLSD